MPRPIAKRAQQICDYVAQGHTREVAAQACGIVPTTMCRWMKRRERQPDGPCGDGVVHQGERCDDGNNTAGDGCSRLCQVEQAF